MFWTQLNKYHDTGLLLLRSLVGLYLAFGHGWSKIAGGPEVWSQLGGAMEGIFGIGFLHTFWGFMAGFAEFFAALLVVLGFVTRPAALLVVIHMGIVSLGHVTGALDGGPEMSLLYGIVFLSLLFVGPGKYSLDAQYAK